MNKHKEQLLERTSKDLEEVEKLIRLKKQEFEGLVTDKSAPILVARDLGIELIESEEDSRPRLDVENIESGIQNVDIQASVRGIKDTHSFDNGEVRSLVIGDETANTQVSFWDDRVEEVESFEVGDKILIKGGYTKMDISDWQKDKYGVPAVNIGDNTTVSKIKDEQSSKGGENK